MTTSGFTTFLNNQIDQATGRGHKWARSCAALALSTQDREYLLNDANAMAHRLPASPFDPAVNAEDKLKADEHDKTLHELDDVEMALTQGLVTVTQREQERADLGPDAPPPSVSTWLVVGGTILFAAGFALALFDWVHERLSDPYLAALIALIPSVALGIFVVRCLTNPDSPNKRTMGLVAGVGVSIATGILRYAFSSDELVIATALSLLELFLVCLLDWQGKHLQARHQKWLTEHEARSRADHRLDAARQQYNRVGEQIAQLEHKKASHVEELTIRSLCFQKITEIEDALRNAIISGAHKGISENQGLKRGVMPSPNPTQVVIS
jgi:hypothetical protein